MSWGRAKQACRRHDGDGGEHVAQRPARFDGGVVRGRVSRARAGRVPGRRVVAALRQVAAEVAHNVHSRITDSNSTLVLG